MESNVMRNQFVQVLLILSSIVTFISCKSEQTKFFNEREFIKKLRITKIVGTTYPSKFGKIDSANGFVSSIYTYDTNGYVIKSEVFNKEDFMKDFNTKEMYFFSNNYQNCRTELYTNNDKLKNIYIDSLNNDKYIERKMFDENNRQTGLIKYKYDSQKLIEILSYDSIGKLESKEVIGYKDNKQIKSITYDKFSGVKNKYISEHYDNYNFSISYNKDGKIDYKSKNIFRNGLTTAWEYTTYSNENDSTVHKEEYTYQDSILFKQKLKYINNEIESAIVYTIYKRK